MLRSDRERLGELTSDHAAEAAAWSVVVADGDGLITQLEERSTLVATGDWQRIGDELTFGVDIGGDDVRGALDELGLGGLDCEFATGTSDSAAIGFATTSPAPWLTPSDCSPSWVGSRPGEQFVATMTGLLET